MTGIGVCRAMLQTPAHDAVVLRVVSSLGAARRHPGRGGVISRGDSRKRGRSTENDFLSKGWESTRGGLVWTPRASPRPAAPPPWRALPARRRAADPSPPAPTAPRRATAYPAARGGARSPIATAAAGGR